MHRPLARSCFMGLRTAGRQRSPAAPWTRSHSRALKPANRIFLLTTPQPEKQSATYVLLTHAGDRG
eukprot:9407745-Pyramimonas_sp.AAC.1